MMSNTDDRVAGWVDELAELQTAEVLRGIYSESAVNVSTVAQIWRDFERDRFGSSPETADYEHPLMLELEKVLKPFENQMLTHRVRQNIARSVRECLRDTMYRLKGNEDDK